jgi:hypothetical protein
VTHRARRLKKDLARPLLSDQGHVASDHLAHIPGDRLRRRTTGGDRSCHQPQDLKQPFQGRARLCHPQRVARHGRVGICQLQGGKGLVPRRRHPRQGGLPNGRRRGQSDVDNAAGGITPSRRRIGREHEVDRRVAARELDARVQATRRRPQLGIV